MSKVNRLNHRADKEAESLTAESQYLDRNLVSFSFFFFAFQPTFEFVELPFELIHLLF